MDSASIVAVSAVVTAATGVMIWAVYVAPQKALEAQWKLEQRHEAAAKAGYFHNIDGHTWQCASLPACGSIEPD
jgi:hypothetical protein